MWGSLPKKKKTVNGLIQLLNFVKTFFIDGWMGPKFIRDNRLSSKTLKTLSVSHLPQEPFLLYLRMAGNLTLTCSSDFYWDNHDTLTRNFFIVSPLLSTFWLTKTLIRRFNFNSIMRFLVSSGRRQLKKWANIGFGLCWFLFGWSLSCSVLRWARLIWKSISSKEYGRSSSHVMKLIRSREASSYGSFWIPGMFLKTSVDLIARFWRSFNSISLVFIWACSFVISTSCSSLISAFSVVNISSRIQSCCSSIFLMPLAFLRPISRAILGAPSTSVHCECPLPLVPGPRSSG